MNLTCFLIVFYIFTATADDCSTDNSHLPAVRLKKHLLCSYEKSLRPVIDHKTPVRVSFRMILKYFVYEEHDSSFSVDSWIVMFWKDEHLKWDPEEYDLIKQIHLMDSEIWMPDISIYNRRVQGGSPSVVDSATCIVSNNGQVLCVPPSRQESLCVADLTNYPFDTQNCTLKIGSWVHSGEELDIKLQQPAISTEELVPNGEWELADKLVIRHPGQYKCCPNNTFPTITYSFKIKRLAGAHTASIILPAIALVAITLTSLWISPSNIDRLTLCCVNLISEFLYVQYVSWMIPMRGDKTPLILLFARDSLLLSAFTVVFTVILKNMVINEKTAPGWVSGTVSVLIGSKPGQFVFLNDLSTKGIASAQGEDDGAAIINNQSVNYEWIIFAKILDRLCFTIYFIIYIVMLISFTP